MRWFLILAAIPCTLFGNTAQQLQESVKGLLEEFRKEEKVSAVAIGIIDKRLRIEEVFTEGENSFHSHVGVHPHSLLRIGPLTELFTASLLSQFVLDRKVQLADPVAKYLPRAAEVPMYGKRQITLLDLATHTSGLPELSKEALLYSSITPNGLMSFLRHYKLEHPPGEIHEHSNLGYALLALALSRTAKQSYPILLQNTLLEPLGLSETMFNTTKEAKNLIVIGYQNGKEIAPQVFENRSSLLLGSNGLYSSPSDMLKWLSFQLSAEQKPFKATKTVSHKVYKDKMALGWEVVPWSEYQLYECSGAGLGFSGYIAFIDEREVGVFVLANSETANVTELGHKAMELLKKRRVLADSTTDER